MPYMNVISCLYRFLVLSGAMNIDMKEQSTGLLSLVKKS
jgi:hypothetical protein